MIIKPFEVLNKRIFVYSKLNIYLWTTLLIIAQIDDFGARLNSLKHGNWEVSISDNIWATLGLSFCYTENLLFAAWRHQYINVNHQVRVALNQGYYTNMSELMIRKPIYINNNDASVFAWIFSQSDNHSIKSVSIIGCSKSRTSSYCWTR